MHPFSIYSILRKIFSNYTFWEKYVTNLLPSLQIWLHELLKRSILANFASCSGNWRNIGRESHQCWFPSYQLCSWGESLAGTIQANISLPQYLVISLQERLLIIFDINFLLKLRRRFMNKALSNVTYLSSAAKVHSREMTVGRMVRQFWPFHLRILWETNFCWTKIVHLLLIPTVRENHDNLLCTQTVFNL